MKIIYGLSKIKKYRRPVVALGVFDGVHRGHSVILRAAAAEAKRIKGTSIALTFWPHPQGEESLYSLRHRLRLIEGLSIDASIVINFNRGFAEISAVDFIRDILFKKIHAQHIFVGRNFRFGKNALGQAETLKNLSRFYHYKLRLFPVLKLKNKAISSTYIRTLIKNGKLGFAEKLLARPVSVLGTVIRGKSLARKLGFSTANINPHHEVIPPSGVYAVRAIFNKKKFFGVCNIGNRKIEVHIFNFRRNIYAKDLEIQFLKKMRKEKRFSSPLNLAGQIKKDVIQAKKYFSLP